MHRGTEGTALGVICYEAGDDGDLAKIQRAAVGWYFPVSSMHAEVVMDDWRWPSWRQIRQALTRNDIVVMDFIVLDHVTSSLELLWGDLGFIGASWKQEDIPVEVPHDGGEEGDVGGLWWEVRLQMEDVRKKRCNGCCWRNERCMMDRRKADKSCWYDEMLIDGMVRFGKALDANSGACLPFSPTWHSKIHESAVESCRGKTNAW